AHKSWLPALTERLRANGFTYIALESMVPSSDPVTDAYPCNLFALRSGHPL
ncbi:MAG: hypothetical protein JWN04_1025, partial [Myxococcaceae bacterium]|nr:hypothetical protein [Myxococcaceae bacterium]